MPLHQRILALFIFLLLALFWTYKKKPILPPQAHVPPTEESMGSLEQMFQDIPCEEGRGIRYTILDKGGVKTTCVPQPSPSEI